MDFVLEVIVYDIAPIIVILPVVLLFRRLRPRLMGDVEFAEKLEDQVEAEEAARSRSLFSVLESLFVLFFIILVLLFSLFVVPHIRLP